MKGAIAKVNCYGETVVGKYGIQEMRALRKEQYFIL